MELKEFTEYLVKSIVNNPDKVRVSEFKLEDDLIIEDISQDFIWNNHEGTHFEISNLKEQ